MVADIRKRFNANFTSEKYRAYLEKLQAPYPGDIEFRVAETPIFLDRGFKEKILAACESIVDTILSPGFDELVKDAVPENQNVPGESSYPDFIAFDFGICEGTDGRLEPQLIEMQGFPTLFAYQVWHGLVTGESFDIPTGYSPYLNGLEKESYLAMLSNTILAGHPKENVILLEILPEKQKTRIDFRFTEAYIGIKTVCLTQLIKKENKLYYLLEGKETPVNRIYNRVIFDDLYQQPGEIQEKGKTLLEPLEVEWAPHPKWFYQISKYTLPFIDHPYVPKTWFLDKLPAVPEDLGNYVLKPLFSFAGQGVVIDVEPSHLKAVKDPSNWILQRKVKYADAIVTPNQPAKAEIRIFYFWEKGKPRPVATNNLARLSKGKMIGVRYNADKDWVGGSLAYFEQ